MRLDVHDYETVTPTDVALSPLRTPAIVLRGLTDTPHSYSVGSRVRGATILATLVSAYVRRTTKLLFRLLFPCFKETVYLFQQLSVAPKKRN